MKLIPTILLLGTAQGIFLALALLGSSSPNRKANIYLGLLCLAFSLDTLQGFLIMSELQSNYLWLILLTWPREFLYGVLIYFYTLALTRSDTFKSGPWQAINFLPAALHCSVAWPLLFLESGLAYNILNNSSELQSSLHRLLAFLLGPTETILGIAHVGVYLLLSLNLIKRHQQQLSQNFSYRETIDLQWLKMLFLSLTMLYTIWIADFVIPIAFEFQLDLNLDLILTLGIVGIIYAIGYQGYRQPRLQTPDSGVSNEPTPVEDKYNNSSLSPELSKTLFKELEFLMQQSQVYKDNRLSLSGLSEQIEVSRHYLSQVINENTDNNFFDYINAYRVNDVKLHLRDKAGQKTNLLNLALEAGFNSKSAFYSSFKKHTGMTPRAYQETLNPGSNHSIEDNQGNQKQDTDSTNNRYTQPDF